MVQQTSILVASSRSLVGEIYQISNVEDYSRQTKERFSSLSGPTRSSPEGEFPGQSETGYGSSPLMHSSSRSLEWMRRHIDAERGLAFFDMEDAACFTFKRA
jgi:hypothetical protein